MVLLLPLLTYGGLASCSLGALLALVGVAKGRQARQLGTAVQVDSLAGEGSGWQVPAGALPYALLGPARQIGLPPSTDTRPATPHWPALQT